MKEDKIYVVMQHDHSNYSQRDWPRYWRPTEAEANDVAALLRNQARLIDSSDTFSVVGVGESVDFRLSSTWVEDDSPRCHDPGCKLSKHSGPCVWDGGTR